MAVNIAFSNETTIAIITFAVAIVIASVMALARRNEEFTVSLLNHKVNELFNRVRVLEFENWKYKSYGNDRPVEECVDIEAAVKTFKEHESAGEWQRRGWKEWRLNYWPNNRGWKKDEKKDEKKIEENEAAGLAIFMRT